jgi:hypothetical protein
MRNKLGRQRALDELRQVIRSYLATHAVRRAQVDVTWTMGRPTALIESMQHDLLRFPAAFEEILRDWVAHYASGNPLAQELVVYWRPVPTEPPTHDFGARPTIETRLPI